MAVDVPVKWNDAEICSFSRGIKKCGIRRACLLFEVGLISFNYGRHFVGKKKSCIDLTGNPLSLLQSRPSSVFKNTPAYHTQGLLWRVRVRKSLNSEICHLIAQTGVVREVHAHLSGLKPAAQRFALKPRPGQKPKNEL